MRIATPLALLVLAGTLLRAAPIADRPVSLDEALTWRAAGKPWTAFLTWSHHPDHPPLSFALVRISMALTGTDAEWALRLPSVVAGALSIPAAAAVGSAFSPAAGLAMAALVAVDPVLVEQARTARMYPLFTLFFVLAVGLSARVASANDRGPRGVGRDFRWAALGLVLGAAIWTHALGVVVWLGMLAAIPVARRARARARLAGSLAIAATFAIPGIVVLLRGDFGGRGRPEEAAAVVGQWKSVAGGVLHLFGYGILGWLLVLAGLAGLVVFARRAKVTSALLGVVAVFTLAAVLLAASARPFGIERYLNPVRVAILVGVSVLATSPRSSRGRAVACAGVTVLGLVFAWQAIPRSLPPVHRVGGVARALAPRVTAETPVVFRPAYLRHVGAYYGIRPAVQEADTGTTWILTHDQRFLHPQSGSTLPDEVRRHLPAVAAGRGFAIDLEDLDRELANEGALAIRINDGGITILSPEGRISEPGQRGPTADRFESD